MRGFGFVMALTLLPLVTSAQIGNPAFMVSDTRFERPGVPAPNQPNNTDKLFAQLLTEGGMAEVSFGELAIDRAQASEVNEFAQRMVSDHSSANSNLMRIAADSNIPLADELNPEHQVKRTQLEVLDDMSFDLEYMRGQVVDHQKAIQLLIWEIGSGQDAELQRFAAETLPVVMEHLGVARTLVDELSRAPANAVD